MDTSLALPPAIPNYYWRWLVRADAPALHALEQRCAAADNNPDPPTLHDCMERLDDPHTDLSATLCAANTAGHLIASAWVTFDGSMQHEYRAFLDGRIDPAYRGQGLEHFVLEWMETSARQGFAAITNDRPQVMRLDGYEHNAVTFALYEQHGFRFVLAEDEMRCDLDQPVPIIAVPVGMTFVGWTPERAGQFFQVYDQAFRDRPGFPGWTEAVWRHAFTGHDEFRADLSLLLLTQTQGTGYALCAVDKHASDTGLIIQMGVHPSWRNRGLGAALLSEMLQRFKAKGLQYAALEVNVNNPQAARLYERMGFRRTKRYTSYRKTL